MAKRNTRRVPAGQLGTADLATDDVVYVTGLSKYYTDVKTFTNKYGEFEAGKVLRANQRRSVVKTLKELGVESKSQLEVWVAQHSADEIYAVMKDTEDVGFTTAVLFTIALKDKMPGVELILGESLRRNLLEAIDDTSLVRNRCDEVSTRVNFEHLLAIASYSATALINGLRLKEPPTVEAVVAAAFNAIDTVIFDDGSIMSKRIYNAERSLFQLASEEVMYADDEPSEYELCNLDDEQSEALRSIIHGKNKMSAIDGGPGTGKSHTITALVHHYGQDKCLVCSYTNKACVNLNQRLPSYTCCDVEGVRTINSLKFRTEVNRKFCDKLTDVRCLIVDECSVCSSDIMADVLYVYSKCSADCKLVLVGDVNQLPPVAAYGTPYKRLIERGLVATYKLNNYHRSNSQGIYEAFKKFRESGTHTVERCDGVQIAAVGSLSGAANIVANSYKLKADAEHLACIAETNAQCNAINECTIACLYPNAVMDENDKYVLDIPGMRVMACTNIRNKSGELLCAKNEICELVSIGKYYTYKRKINEQTFDVPADDARQYSYFSPAYCCTVHKYQGCEEDRIIYVMDNDVNMNGNAFSLQKELKYVAFSRAKVELDILGISSSIANTVRLEKINVRVADSNNATMYF